MLQCVVPSRTPVISPQIHLVWHRDRNRGQLLLLPCGIRQFITPLRPFCALRSPNCNHSFCWSLWTYLIDVSAKYYHRGLQSTQNNTAAAATTTTATTAVKSVSKNSFQIDYEGIDSDVLSRFYHCTLSIQVNIFPWDWDNRFFSPVIQV